MNENYDDDFWSNRCCVCLKYLPDAKDVYAFVSFRERTVILCKECSERLEYWIDNDDAE